MKLKHRPLHNDDGEPYEFELKPINGKMIRGFHLCRYCGVLFEAGTHGGCADCPITETDDR